MIVLDHRIQSRREPINARGSSTAEPHTGAAGR